MRERVATVRGEMTAEQMAEWIETHPPLPGHVFMDPCGQDEGSDRCWYCGHPKAAHPGVAAQADTPTPEQFAEIDRLVAESKAEMAAQADTAPGVWEGHDRGRLRADQVVPFLRSVVASGERLSDEDNADIAAALAEPGRDAGLRDALWTETPRETAAREKRDGGDDE